MMKLSLKTALYEAVLRHLESMLPNEGCGLLAGATGWARVYYPIDNVAHSRTRYAMDARQLVEAILDIDERGLEMLAICHSHPAGPAHPSPTDVAHAHYPDALHLIVSFADRSHPGAGLFRIVNGTIEAAILDIV